MSWRSWPPAAQRGQLNYEFFDRFTWIHLGIGGVYGFIGLPGWAALVLAIGWEVIESPLKYHVPLLFPGATADTWMNIVGDIAAVVLGWEVATWITRVT